MPSPAGRMGPVLDGPSLVRLKAAFGDEQGVREILQEFVVSSGRLVRQMASALKRQRTSEVERAAHTLKSMARLLGATELAEACRAVEFRAHGASAPPVPEDMVARVAVHTRQAQEAVERLLR
ncbi:MAG: Hpt domain-containing protein [Thermoplasmatota archaeon]